MRLFSLTASLFSALFVYSLTGVFFTATAADTFSMGIEGFHDNYKEPDVGVDNNANFGSVTGNYSHDWGRVFGAIDGRGSYGKNDYSSPSGTISGISEWEFEGRLRVGFLANIGHATLSPYTGVGMRYFDDENKGLATNLGYFGYDRRITQAYIPIGATYSFVTEGGWTIAPNIEYDQFIWGNVNSRLQNIGPNYYNINNTQHDGFGVRGEFMVGQAWDGFSWQFGPFVRYWNIEDSDTSSDPTGSCCYVEPHNERVQYGLALRVLW